jgi:hypothetical protein
MWNNHRSADNLFAAPSATTTHRLIDQGAMLQILAALAWNSADYPKLP